MVDFTPALRGTLETTPESAGVIATPAEAIAGLRNDRIMTPLRTQQFTSNLTFSFAPINQAVPLSNNGLGYFLGKGSVTDDDFQWILIPAGGTVQTVTVASSNGFAGSSSADPINPVLTLSTTVNGLLEGNGTAVSAASVTGTGSVVRANGPTLVGPALGTPVSVNLTNAVGLPVGAITGLGAGVGAFLATPSSSNLAAAVTDETGTGALVFATSPVLVTPNLGTPSAIDLTNATNTPRPSIRVTAVGSTATLTPNSNTTDIAAVTAQAAGLTIAAPTGSPADGQQITIRIRDNGTTRALTWNAAYVPFATGQLPTTTTINKTHYLVFWWNAATSVWELVCGNPVAGLWGA